MIAGKRVLAIIPARAGSKRVKNKNIRELAGTPLIGWTLKDLNKSRYIDHSYVSTDSVEIQEIAKKYGVDCEPLRPSELATDTATTIDLVLHVLNKIHTDYQIIVLLQPTSPFRKIEDVDSAIKQLIEREANSIASVCELDVHPSWTVKLDESLDMKELVHNLKQKRSQDLEKFYKLNGAIYVAKKEELFRENSFYMSVGTIAYIMKKNDSIDIDTEEDFLIAGSFASMSLANSFVEKDSNKKT